MFERDFMHIVSPNIINTLMYLFHSFTALISLNELGNHSHHISHFLITYSENCKSKVYYVTRTGVLAKT